MTSFLDIIRATNGVQYALVESHRIERWDREDALRMLRGIDDDPFSGHTFARLAGTQDVDALGRESILRGIAEQIARGSLVPVALDEPRMGRPIFARSGGSRRPSDDEIVDLSSLRETDPTYEYGWVSIELVDGRGRPFAGFELRLVHADGRRDRVVLDAAGRHKARRVLLPGPSRIELPARLDLPMAARSGLAMDGFVRAPGDLVVARKPTGPLLLMPLDRHHRLVVADEPAVTEIPIDGWAQGSKVMRWGGMRSRSDGTVATTRGALRLALWRGRGRTLAVAGHADALGQDADNEVLSLERARSVQLFAAGELDAWAEHAFAHATKLDLQCALVACHASAGHGSIAVGDDAAMVSALGDLRCHAGLADDEGPVTVNDWRAIADAYDVELARMLTTDLAGLAEIRAAVRWAEPAVLAYGERWPRAAAELEDVDPNAIAALPHRRGALLVFESRDDIQLALANTDAVYDGTFARNVLPIPGEVAVHVEVATVGGARVAHGRAWIDVADLGAAHHVADAHGVVRIVTLRGDPVQVIAAFDAQGHGLLTSGEEQGT